MPHPADQPEDLRALAGHAATLQAAVEQALGAWVVGSVERRWAAWSGRAAPEALIARAREAATAAEAQVLPELRHLLEADVDEQRANPLAVIRRAVSHPTAVLAEAGVPPVERDEQAVRMFPDDRYDLTPAGFADLDPSVHEPGLVWGAAKAHVVLRRRRAEGRR